MTHNMNNAMTKSSSNILPISVITTCYGRNQHLYNLLASLQSGSKKPAEVIIVNDDADVSRLETYDLNILQIPTTASEAHIVDSSVSHIDKEEGKGAQNDPQNYLPNDLKKDLKNKPHTKNSRAFDIGLNRNLGAKQSSYDTLIFLDVDCIVSTDFIAGLVGKMAQYPQALIMGQPRYLTRPLTEQESQCLERFSNDFKTSHDMSKGDLSQSRNWLQSLSILNPYRPNLVSDSASIGEQSTHYKSIEKTQDYGAFWSLCFAIHKSQFERIGGFDTNYVGYGAEDTDFAFTARQQNINFYLTNDVVYHQQHAVYRPPLNHLNSIVINANRFFEKWHHWPMSGWLAEFAQMGLITWRPDQSTAITLLRQPTEHEISLAHHPDAPFV